MTVGYMSLGLALFTALLLCSAGRVRGSQGDKEPVYRDCVKQCARTNCTGAKLRGFQSSQPPYMALTGKFPSDSYVTSTPVSSCPGHHGAGALAFSACFARWIPVVVVVLIPVFRRRGEGLRVRTEYGCGFMKTSMMNKLRL